MIHQPAGSYYDEQAGGSSGNDYITRVYVPVIGTPFWVLFDIVNFVAIESA